MSDSSDPTWNNLPSPASASVPTGKDQTTTFMQTYTARRRQILDVLNVLTSLGIQNDIDLPRAAVLGSQSAGKSSLIESMSGISLPRASGTCTRCPMECRLQFGETWSCNVMLRFEFDSGGNRLSTPREVSFGGPILDKADVTARLRRAQRAILRPSIDANKFLDDSDLETQGSSLSFSKNYVCIHVQGPEVPDLTFYDLPGIIANVSDGGNEKDIQLVEDLAKMYISQPNCIVLLVITCETDFENQGAYRLIKADESLKSRTVGVLTKPDRIEPGNEQRWLRILRNESNTLENGGFAVKQPDFQQLERGISWEAARIGERDFFSTTQPWSSLEDKHRNRIGSTALAEHLGQMLSDLASTKLPAILSSINRLLEDVDQELRNYPAPTYDDPKREIIMLLRNFTKDVAKHIKGLPPSCTDDPIDPFTAGLVYSMNKKYDMFRLQVHRTAPQFRPWERVDPIDLSVTRNLLREVKADDPPSGCTGYEFYIEEVMDLAERSRTRELPGNYPFAVKVTYIDETIRSWRDLAAKCFEKVRDIMIDHANRLVHDHFGRYAHGGLLEAVNNVVKEQFTRRETVTRKKIESICRGEDRPCTQNEDYFFYCRSKLLVKYKAIYQRSKGHGSTFGLISEDHHNEKRLVNEAIAALARLNIHGLKPDDLVKLFPENKMDPALEIMSEARAYFQVAYKRFGDNVPNQIDASFVSGFDDDLELALVYTIPDVDTCSKWLQESPQVVNRRGALNERKKRLQVAKSSLGPIVRLLSRSIFTEPSPPPEPSVPPTPSTQPSVVNSVVSSPGLRNVSLPPTIGMLAVLMASPVRPLYGNIYPRG
ncbi:hypothetical protein M407DRAFT_28173 [Tulasnella calospora MUT 4182]|uniref:Dynamin-type G domain-containing protein n=1 Tax=Tulasnella calospora MUT 4182 TaxID=1051891 RepID=A0A0C3KLP4_9AGAM|nr:hypothetical protein M407DRAFT_28173 [Tulasnella calospora MUT 4182]